jgi:ABC-2 type transport system permease protein
MHSILKVVGKDLLRWRRSPLFLIVFMSFPVLFSLLIGLTFGESGSEEMAPIRIALVDEDGGLAARFLASSFGQGTMPVKFEVTHADLLKATSLVEDNKVSAVVRIPAGFTDSLLQGNETSLYVVRNPAEAIYPEIVKGFVEVFSVLGSAALRVFDEPLRRIEATTAGADAGPANADVAAISVLVNQRMRGVGRYALPPAIRIVSEADAPSGGAQAEDDEGSSPFRIALFVLPGMATFALMTLAIASMGDLRREENAGTLARQFCTPHTSWVPVLGKMISTLILALACIVILAIVGALWGRVSASPAGFFGLAFSFAVAATGFAVLTQSIFGSERAGAAFGSILVMIMSMLGGSWFPLEGLPRAIRSLSPFMMNYWANDGFRRLLFDKASAASLLPNMAVMLGIGAVLTMIGVVFLRRRYLKGA